MSIHNDCDKELLRHIYHYADNMTSMDAETLPRDITLCHTLIKELVESLGKYEKRVGRLQHTIEQLLRQRYGRKSERLEDIDPALLLPLATISSPKANPFYLKLLVRAKALFSV